MICQRHRILRELLDPTFSVGEREREGEIFPVWKRRSSEVSLEVANRISFHGWLTWLFSSANVSRRISFQASVSDLFVSRRMRREIICLLVEQILSWNKSSVDFLFHIREKSEMFWSHQGVFSSCFSITSKYERLSSGPSCQRCE